MTATLPLSWKPLDQPPRSFPATGHLTNCGSSSRTCNYVKNWPAPMQGSPGVGIRTSHSLELHIDTDSGHSAGSGQGQDSTQSRHRS